MEVSINELAERAYNSALQRGKIHNKYINHDETVSSLAEEFNEFILADECQKSPHITDVSHAVEELTDLIIVCMTELYRRDINIDEMLLSKIMFNESRPD